MTAVGCSRAMDRGVDQRPGRGDQTGPTRAPNLPPTRYLRRQSLGTSLSSYDPVLGEIALDAPLLHHCVAAHHRPGPPIR
jgi:hypothetical protein